MGRPHPSGVYQSSPAAEEVALIATPGVTFPVLAVTELGAPGSDLSEVAVGWPWACQPRVNWVAGLQVSHSQHWQVGAGGWWEASLPP